MQTEILIYDGFDELDAIGPFEVLSPMRPALVTLEPAAIVTASHGLVVTPHKTLSEAPGLRFESAETAASAARLLEHQRLDTAPAWS